ncbi:MAG TPA: sulfatase-like hydrolase/transferase, partial [Vicinamibacteria bacterium]
MRKTPLLAAAATLVLGGCGKAPPTDLLEARAALVEARAAGLEREAVLERGAAGMRLNDVLVRGFPAGPPGRLRFTVDVPRDGRFQALVAIDPRYQQRPGVEFVVKVRRDKREEVAFSLLVDPIARAEHRGFVPVDVDLGRFAGKGRELVLETRGYEETGEPGQAFWGTPAITAVQRAPLAILYLVDTLRADHTGVYGYKRNTTPELDAFAKEAIVFEAAVAHASWTKPSVASILTSHLPGQHRAVQLRDPLDPSQVTIAGRLDARGFATGAAIANSV